MQQRPWPSLASLTLVLRSKAMLSIRARWSEIAIDSLVVASQNTLIVGELSYIRSYRPSQNYISIMGYQLTRRVLQYKCITSYMVTLKVPLSGRLQPIMSFILSSGTCQKMKSRILEKVAYLSFRTPIYSSTSIFVVSYSSQGTFRI